MENFETKSSFKFSDYLYILYKWKRFLIINLVIIGIITTIIAFLLPNEYKATATIMIPPNDQLGGLGGLTSLLGGKSSIASMGSKFFGTSTTSEDVLLGILNSRTALTEVVKKFDLMKYYEIDDNNIDKTLKAVRGDIIAEPNEYGMIEFSVTNKNPIAGAEITNYLVDMVDSMNIELNIERAKNNRIFIEKRYVQNVSDLKKAEDSLYNFQKKYGIVAVPEQLEVTVKAAAEVEAELTKKDMESFFMLQQFGENSPQYLGVKAEVNMLKNKVQEMKNSPDLSATSNILYPFKQMPDMAIQFLRTKREVELQQTVMEFVLPMYEQAKVEEQKSIPTIMIIDRAVPPDMKYGPKRLAIIIGILLLFSFLFVPMVFIAEKSVSKNEFQNPLQVKGSKFFKRIIKIYRMKF